MEVVYILNNLGTKIEDVRVVGRCGKSVLWFYSVLPEADIIRPDILRKSEGIEEIAKVRKENDVIEANKNEGE